MKPPWLVVTRHWDETPVEVLFGNLRDLLAPCASYWWPASKRRPSKRQRHAAPLDASASASAASASAASPPATWCKLNYAEFKERNAGREPKRGTLEMLGHRTSLIWAEPSMRDPNFFAVRREDLHQGPLFLEATSSSNIYEALTLALPHLDFTALERIASYF